MEQRLGHNKLFQEEEKSNLKTGCETGTNIRGWINICDTNWKNTLNSGWLQGCICRNNKENETWNTAWIMIEAKTWYNTWINK